MGHASVQVLASELPVPYRPALQFSQLASPKVKSLNFPDGQILHPACATWFEYFPLGQFVQLPAPAAVWLPSWPAAQGLQLVELPDEYLPAGHSAVQVLLVRAVWLP